MMFLILSIAYRHYQMLEFSITKLYIGVGEYLVQEKFLGASWRSPNEKSQTKAVLLGVFYRLGAIFGELVPLLTNFFTIYVWLLA